MFLDLIFYAVEELGGYVLNVGYNSVDGKIFAVALIVYRM